MELTTSQRESIKKACEKHQVVLAYLFGSAARGTLGPLSDIDIAIVFEKKPADLKRYSAVRSALQALFDRDIDLVDVTDVDNPLLKHRIVAGGHLLHSADQLTRLNFERRARQEHEDTRYLRATQARIMYRQIKERAKAYDRT